MASNMFVPPPREEPFYPHSYDDEFNAGDAQAKVAWPRILTPQQQEETARASYAVWKAQGMLPKYENQEEYRAFFLEDWKRGYQYRVATLQKNHADDQRFSVMPEFAGREVARITIEAQPVEVGSIHNRALHEKGIWMLQCVGCREYHTIANEELDQFDETDGWQILWIEAPPEQEMPDITSSSYWPNKETEETVFWMCQAERPIRNVKRLIREEGLRYAASEIKALLSNQLLTNLSSKPDYPVHFSNSQNLLKELVEMALSRIDYQFLAQHIGREDVAPWADHNG